jgi:putative DNA primase/helicase
MDYINEIKAAGFGENTLYPRNDIGITRLFYDLNSGIIRYGIESKVWFFYDGRKWLKKNGQFRAMELCKDFTQAFSEYAGLNHAYDEEFIKYAGKLTNRRNREGILGDARSIAPVSLSDFDRDKYLLNLQNGTLNLNDLVLLPHNPADMITKIAPVKFDPEAKCERWDSFIDEVMCGDKDTALFLQKALGYALTGDTSFDCFFVLYGEKTRNGKSTLMETVAHILGEYACTAAPQTFSKRSGDGASPTPDIARLQGARLVNMQEPEKGMELNAALMKQFTGGDTLVGRYLNENPFEFMMESKIFIGTNHLPRVSDDTVFASGRVKIIPFERHFTPQEQDKTLKQYFRRRENKSAILNWLITGWQQIKASGFEAPAKVNEAIAAYRQEADIIGVFLSESITPDDNYRIPTSNLYGQYATWAKDNGYRPLSNRGFTVELRRRYELRRDGVKGNMLVGFAYK